ncbi:hypothetical protein [Brevibacterium aurantiacum]|uniref:Uncharacterized protein n=1 Tax=Brevibacterium aurantiacum TaxID=273384 RepID=A0A556CN58_BREAU|nr:hypothetical protein [Brevibacterium aurantiacum]TSI18874.1 hypothetical protein FO013_04920 [Brevibacterium aurantiacum]
MSESGKIVYFCQSVEGSEDRDEIANRYDSALWDDAGVTVKCADGTVHRYASRWTKVITGGEMSGTHKYAIAQGALEVISTRSTRYEIGATTEFNEETGESGDLAQCRDEIVVCVYSPRSWDRVWGTMRPFIEEDTQRLRFR